MSNVKDFLKRKDIVITPQRYLIEALGAMAQGLFASLLIGTIIKTLGQQTGLETLVDLGGYATAMSGPAMAVAIGWALHCPPLVLFSLVTVGYSSNALGGAGGPLAVLIIAIVAAELGKETIDSYNQSENRGAQTSHGLNYQKLGKELMSQDEIATMDGGKCILQVRGVRPFFSEKYDITRHPRYQYLSDADKKNTFDVDSYLSSLRRKKRRVITEDEPFDLYDIELSDEDFAVE